MNKETFKEIDKCVKSVLEETTNLELRKEQHKGKTIFHVTTPKIYLGNLWMEDVLNLWKKQIYNFVQEDFQKENYLFDCNSESNLEKYLLQQKSKNPVLTKETLESSIYSGLLISKRNQIWKTAGIFIYDTNKMLTAEKSSNLYFHAKKPSKNLKGAILIESK